MAVQLHTQPTRFAPAYKPVLWTFISNRYPNIIAGESNVVIIRIAVATATDVLLYGGSLAVGDVFIDHDAVAIGVFTIGQAVLVANNIGYDGTHHVLKEVSSTITVIDAPPNDEYFDGTLTKYYERLQFEVVVTMENSATPITKTIAPDINGDFNIDVRDIAQRTFADRDVFDRITPDQTAMPGQVNGYITQSYKFSIYESFMVPDLQGINEYTVPKGPQYNSALNYVVNSVQPYHHVDPITGDTDLLWEDDLVSYILEPGRTNQRFLTYAPRGWKSGQYKGDQAQPIGLDDNYWLAFLYQGAGVPIDMVVTSYNATNFPYQVSTQTLGSPVIGSVMVAVGPKNLVGTGLLEPNAHHYTVVIRNPAAGFMSEVFAFTIDRECYKDSEHMYWLNPFGAVDAFTFTHVGSRKNTVKRTTISKPHMHIDLQVGFRKGDWQRRMIATEFDLIYSATTKTLKQHLLTYLADDLYLSADVRLYKYTTVNSQVWTWVIPTGTETIVPNKAGRLEWEYQLGIDEVRQRR